MSSSLLPLKQLWIRAALLTAMVPGFASLGESEWYVPESAGVRTGFTATSRGHNFHQVDGFLNWFLPWEWDLGRGWDLQTELAFSAGWIGDRGNDAAILTLGPGLVLHRRDFPLSLEGGSSPTWITERRFATKNFSSEFQFTSYLGLNWNVTERFRMGYRFQHMSNGGIALPNPGLNLHAVAVSLRF